MSVLFDPAIPKYFNYTGIVGPTTPPYTMAAMVWLDSALPASARTIMMRDTSSSRPNDHCAIGCKLFVSKPPPISPWGYAWMSTGGGSFLVPRYETIFTNAGGEGGAPATGLHSVSTGAWYLVVGIWTSTASRTIYLLKKNDTSTYASRSSTLSISPQNLAKTGAKFQIGRSEAGTLYWQAAEAGWCSIWSTALALSDLHGIAQGLLPTNVRPDSLVDCWPLFNHGSNEFGVRRVAVMTGFGSPGQSTVRHAPQLWQGMSPYGGNLIE